MGNKSNDPPKSVDAILDLARSKATEDARTFAKLRPGSKIVFYLAAGAVLIACGIGVYGIFTLPDIPIRPGGGGFVTKTGKPSSLMEYERYLAWSRAMLITFPTAMALFFVFAFMAGRDRRTQQPDGR